MVRKIPERMCVGCRSRRPKRDMVRVVRTPEGDILIDPTGKRAGRGAYVCPAEGCLLKAMKNRGLERALEVPLGSELTGQLVAQIESSRRPGNGGE